MGASDGEVKGPPIRLLGERPDERALVIVLLSEGFQDAELGQFENACDVFVRNLETEDWFRDSTIGIAPHAGAVINVYRLNVASVESGIDDPRECGGSGAAPRTFFDGQRCPPSIMGGRQPRRVLSIDDFLLLDTLNTHVPSWDAAIVLVNDDELGGSTSPLVGRAIVALDPCWLHTIMHELGHLLFGLGDEYEYLGHCDTDGPEWSTAPADEPTFPNVTAETDPARLKWRDLVSPGVSIPTMRNPDCSQCDPNPNVLDEWDMTHVFRAIQRIVFQILEAIDDLFSIFGARPKRCLWYASDPDDIKIGLFEGANYFKCGNFRPAFKCRMRDQFRPYCAVCRRAIAEHLRMFA